MNKLSCAWLPPLPLVWQPAFATTEQQNRMASCNKEAGAMKGEQRKAFMKECLKKG